MLSPQNAIAWSNKPRASRNAPSAFLAITCSDSWSIEIPSSAVIFSRRCTISSTEIRLKSKRCTLDNIVGRTLCGSVVANMKIACSGGSSSVFKRALKAAFESMWTSSTINILYRPFCGGILTLSRRWCTSSTLLFEAASISMIFNVWFRASPSTRSSIPLITRARTLAMVVLPTPRGPQNM